MQEAPVMTRSVGAGAMIAAAVALAILLAMLMFAQTADFGELGSLDALTCQTLHARPAPSKPDPAHPAPSKLDPARTDAPELHCHAAIAASGASADLALLAPVFRDSLVVAVNGVTVGQARLNQWQMPGRLATLPAMIAIPRGLLRPASNRIDIAVTGLAGRAPSLGRLYIGGEAGVIRKFRQLWFVAEVLPTLILGGQAALALMCFTIWNRRRREAAFGWFALVLCFDTLRGSPIIPALGVDAPSISYWSLLVPFSSAAYLMFAMALVGAPFRGRSWLPWSGPVLVAAAAAFATPVVTTRFLMPIGITIVCGNLLAAAVVLARGWRRGVPGARLVCLCTILFMALVAHDVLLLLQVIEGQIAIARPGLLVLLIAMITLMINRFTGAMAELDRTADTLRIRTAEIEAQLRRADLKLRQQREMTILAQERARLMRDLHDGLGGDMVAVLALAERGDGAGQEIAFHARAALADMRLIIASLEDYGGDLAMALGAWKERAEPQIVAAGMILHWQIEELGETLQFGPAQVLDILRILQEALTNVIHHARAASITVGAALAADGLSLTFTDDGDGLAASARAGARVGRGLANMRSRAHALGGELEIISTSAGTSIVLHVPLVQMR